MNAMSHTPPCAWLALLCAACPAWWGADDVALSSTSGPTSSPDSTSTTTAAPTAAATDDPSTAAPDASTSSTTIAESTAGATTVSEPPPPIDDAWCSTLDAGQVYFAGTYQPAASYRDALARPGSPRQGCVGFEDHARALVVRPTDNKLLFVDSSRFDGVKVFAPDPQPWDEGTGEWQYPTDPYGNDEYIATPPCPLGPLRLLIHPGDGTIVYNCVNGTLSKHYDQAGELVYSSDEGDDLVAVGIDGTLLTVGYFVKAGSLAVVPPGDVPTAVVVPAGGDPASVVLAARSTADGFWVVVKPEGTPAERWSVDLVGAAARDGQFAATQQGHAPGEGTPVRLDGDGELVYGRSSVKDTFSTEIVRCPLVPGEAAVIYTEVGSPAVSWPTDAEPFVYAGFVELFTGP